MFVAVENKLNNTLTYLTNRNNFAQIADKLIIFFCCSVAISIALSQIMVGALLALWLLLLWRAKKDENTATILNLEDLQKAHYLVPASLWLFTCLVSTLVGVDPARSGKEFLSSFLYILFPICIYQVVGTRATFDVRLAVIKKYLFYLCLGQCLAALHTFLSSYLGYEIKPNPPGPVTESGQLVMVIPACICLLFTCNQVVGLGAKSKLTLILGSVVFMVSLLGLCWSGLLTGGLSTTVTITTSLAILILIIYNAPLVIKELKRAANKNKTAIENVKVILFLLILLSVTLILNLKRGPWMGIFCISLIIGFLYSRRLAIGTLAAGIVSAVALAPVRDRILALPEHFTITGGRQDMWALGADLIMRYPLGLGVHNARFMRVLDPTLPILHRHMHNNLLNVAVETGWLGLVTFIWWLFSIIALGFKLWRNEGDKNSTTALLSLFLSTALIGWQVAGLVEYNFGDGEVRFIAFFFMGIILALTNRANR